MNDATTLRIMTFGIIIKNATLSIMAEHCYGVSFMLSVIHVDCLIWAFYMSFCWISLCWMLLCWVSLCCVVILSIVMLIVIILSIIMLSVVAPIELLHSFASFLRFALPRNYNHYRCNKISKNGSILIKHESISSVALLWL